MAKAFTVAAIEKMKPDPLKRLEVPDGLLAGLYFVIQPSGARSWAIRYRAGGKPKKLTIGSFPTLDLSDARDRAKIELVRVQKGADPAAEKQEAKRRVNDEDARNRDLFRTVAQRYLREYASKRRNYPEKCRLLGLRPKGDEWQVITGRAVAIWSDRRVQDITRRDVREHVEQLAEDAPIGANRAFAELRKYFNWTVGKDILAVSPMAGLQPPSEENASRNRILIKRAEIPGSSDDELRWLWMAADSYDRDDAGESKGGHGRKLRGPFGPFVQMLVLTGQRRTEVSAMTWLEVDLAGKTWTIPPSRTKNGKPHSVPLSDAAVAILESMPRIKGADHVFTTDGKNPISGFSRMKRRLDMLMSEQAGMGVTIPAWTIHDLRRTVAAGMQRVGVRLEVTEKVLNHLSGSFAGIVGIYQVDDFHHEKRAALDAWGRFVTRLIDSEQNVNVVT